MLNEEKILCVIHDLVPHWNISSCQFDTKKIKIRIGKTQKLIESPKSVSPSGELSKWIKEVEILIDNILSMASSGSEIIDIQISQSMLVEKWLQVLGFNLNWFDLFDYNRKLEYRTYENASIGFTFIYNPEFKGTFNIMDENHQKYLDVLGETNYTYIKVDKDWSYVDYDYIDWGKIIASPKYKLVPEFLYPYQCVLNNDKECGITRTKRGDLIIFGKKGLIAAFRKGNWKIYDSATIKNTLKMIVGSSRHWLAANLFDILFDLSYRRHGALIIFDKFDSYSLRENYIVNDYSLFNSKGSDLHRALEDRVSKICINKESPDSVSKPLLLELASADGALVIKKDGSILGFGSMIKSHLKANTEIGARSSAALSAFYYDTIPFKVSSDGEISILIKDKSNNPLKITFL